ncbi:DeoR/GlpR family DNA-binding transcription regulator [Companilactobacillus mishanensis]|uniref:DeoR/GlpR family DNA-binding transcription regulator n=1 Tax=Companilactobacillus mishanensis TaxID=2486008 RepID=UPI001561D0D4|nr:DeoR/GlpR family DNA-binding transcription regulator [Companilactobacillus mishanensis]
MKTINKRRDKLLEIIKNEGVTNVANLAKSVNVSEMSVRRDCQVLEKMGEIKLSFGKIEYLENSSVQEEGNRIDQINSKIAQMAVNYIDDDQMIFINSSKTAIKVLNYIEDRHVNIITNNLRAIGSTLNSESSLILSGGEIRNGADILTGDIALETFRNMRASVSLIGCAGFDVKNGLTTTNIHEAQINRIIINNCQKLIVLANYTKINKTTNFNVGALSDVDLLITDVYADEEYIKQIRNAGVEVIQVSI